MNPSLEIREMRAGYGDLTAVRDVSLQVVPGTVTALLGRNGAGKTTVLRAASGLVPTTDGSVHLTGRDVTTMRAHRRATAGLAFVQEGKRIFKRLSVEENLQLGGYAGGLNRSEIASNVDQAFDRFPMLAERRQKVASTLSGGQQQMLAIGQALMSSPTVLMLDEPSGGLAPSVVADVAAVIADLAREGLAVLLVEQAVNFALALSRDVVVMDLGRVVLTTRSDSPTIEQDIEAAYFGASTTPAEAGLAKEHTA